MNVGRQRADVILLPRVLARGWCQEARPFLMGMVESGQGGSFVIWAIDSSGTTTYVGPEWDEFVMPHGEASIARRVEVCVHCDDRATAIETVVEAKARRLPFTLVFRLLHKDGSYRKVVARGVPTFKPGTGELVGLIGTTYAMIEGDLTVTSVGWTEIRIADRNGLRSTVDRIADHLLVARAMAEQAGEARLVAIADQALKQVFAPYGFDPTLRQ